MYVPIILFLRDATPTLKTFLRHSLIIPKPAVKKHLILHSRTAAMLVAVGFTAAATTRRGLLRSTPAVVSARTQASRALSVSATLQPNTHPRTLTCGPDAVSSLQLQARAYVTLKSPHSAVSSSKASRCFSSNSWNWSSGGDKTSPSSSSASSSGVQTPGQSTADATATDGPADVDAKIQREVLDRCEALHASLMPLNEKVSTFVILRCPRLVGCRYHRAHPISPISLIFICP